MKLDSTIAAVVTGGASGLGEATARALAAKGVKVALFDLQAEKGEAVAAEIGGIFCEVNVTSDESVEAGFEKARAAHGQERILVNCAGVAIAAKTVARDKETLVANLFPMVQFELAIGVNLIGSFRCIAYSAFGMVQADPLEDGERGKEGGLWWRVQVELDLQRDGIPRSGFGEIGRQEQTEHRNNVCRLGGVASFFPKKESRE